MPIPISPILRRTLIRDEVYDSLKTWIIQGALRPKEKLSDKELATRLGVSRTPIREALRRLEDEGLVETAANRWTRVKGATLRDAEQIYPVILSLELLALDLAFADLSSTYLGTLEEANGTLRRAVQTSDIRAAVRADTSFHRVIVEAAVNSELASIVEHLKNKYQRIELAYFSRAQSLLASTDEHQKVIDALTAKDRREARAALTENWRASLDRLQTPGGR